MTMRTLAPDEWYERVSRKAYELYEKRGEEWGHDLDDWLTAERLLQEELRSAPAVPDPILESSDEDDSVLS